MENEIASGIMGIMIGFAIAMIISMISIEPMKYRNGVLDCYSRKVVVQEIKPPDGVAGEVEYKIYKK